jgi:hypothetical protein
MSLKHEVIAMKFVGLTLALMGVTMMASGQEALVREKPQQGQLSMSSQLSPFAFIEEVGKWIRLVFKGKPVWQYNYAFTAPSDAKSKVASGFLHPVWSPDGVIVTDWGPKDHYHHRGIFFAFPNTRWSNLAPNFWDISLGRIRFEAFERLELHRDKAVMVAHHLWDAKKDDEWMPIIRERWTIVTYAPRSEEPEHLTFDLMIELVNVTDEPLNVEESRYGGLGYRGARSWLDKSKREVLTSEGKTLADADATDARWIFQGGFVDGQWAGLTLMDHPSNLAFPNRLRVNPDCPYVGFCPMRKMSFIVHPKETMRFCYRIVVHASKPTQQLLEAIWHEFQKPMD